MVVTELEDVPVRLLPRKTSSVNIVVHTEMVAEASIYQKVVHTFPQQATSCSRPPASAFEGVTCYVESRVCRGAGPANSLQS